MKKGMKWLIGTGATVGTILVIVLLLGAVGVDTKLFKQAVTPTGQGGTPVAPGTPNTPGSATTISLSGFDKQATGTTVGVTSYIGVNNQALATGVTTGAPGVAVNVLLVNSTNAYHSAFLADVLPSYAYTKSVAMNKNASVTIAVYNTAKTAMPTGGATVNQTVSTGSAPTMELDLTGASLASTQDLVCVLEGNNSAKIGKLQINGLGQTLIGTAKPSSYTSPHGTSNPIYAVYTLPPLTDAGLKIGSIYAESKAGQDMSGSCFAMTCYTSEYFIDSNANADTVNAYAKKVAEPNVYYGIEDSQGTLKSIGTYQYVGCFQ